MTSATFDARSLSQHTFVRRLAATQFELVGTLSEDMAGLDSYAWERAYERTWEAVEEDEAGLLRTDAHAASVRRRAAGAGAAGGGARLQRGMLRHVFLVLDWTRAMDSSADLKPTRAAACARAAADFCAEFFDQNPISSLGLVLARRGGAERLTELSPARDRHLRALLSLQGGSGGAAPPPCEGDFSLQVALEVAARQLELIPAYGTREILVLHGAHSSVNPGDILGTLSSLIAARVTVSAISLPGEVYIAARIAADTGGRYAVPETYDALRMQLRAHCVPPLRRAGGSSSGSSIQAGGGGGVATSPTSGVRVDSAQMVPMGFPRQVAETPGMCTCHAELRASGFICPRCLARQCDLPAACGACDLQLVSAARLARSHHHLFPVRPYIEVPRATVTPAAAAPAASAPVTAAAADAAKAEAGAGGDDDGRLGAKRRRHPAHSDAIASEAASFADASTHCSGCQASLDAAGVRYVCPACRGTFCAVCDAFIHDTLHTCPGCCCAA